MVVVKTTKRDSTYTQTTSIQSSDLMFAAPRPCMRRFVQCEDNKPVLLDEEETLNHTIANIDLTFSSDVSPTTGTLFVTSRRFVWLSDETAYDFDVQYIALHAICNDPEGYKKPCLYCQVSSSDHYFYVIMCCSILPHCKFCVLV
jgi:hypothetical protein